MTRLWVLKNSTKGAHARERRRKATAIIPERESSLCARTPVPIPAPTLTWRVGNHRKRPGIRPRVPRLIPWIDVWQIPINTSALHEERANPGLSFHAGS